MEKYSVEQLEALRARPVLNIDEAGALYGVSRSTINRARQSGDLAYRKLGRRVLITHEALARWAGIDLAVPFGPHSSSGKLSDGGRTAEAGSDDWSKP